MNNREALLSKKYSNSGLTTEQMALRERGLQIGFIGDTYGTISTNTMDIVSMLGKYLDAENYDDPRANLIASRLLTWALPYIGYAIRLHATFIGALTVNTEDDALRMELENFIDTVPIVQQANPDIISMRGLDALVNLFIRTAMRDGMAFAEEIFENRKPGVNKIMVLPSEKFRFVQTAQGNREDLVHTRIDGTTVTIKPSSHFHQWGYRFNIGPLWGCQINDGGILFGEAILQLLIARIKLHKRFADPVFLDILTWGGDSVKNPDDIAWFKNESQAMQSRIVQGMRASEKGRSAAVTAAFMGDVQHSHQLLGDGAQGSGKWVEEVQLLMKMHAMSTDIPVRLLGFDSTTGLGSERDAIENGILGGTVESLRKQTMAFVKVICDNHLIEMGYNPAVVKTYKLFYRELDTNDAKIMAETSKMIAETFKLHLDNLLTMFSNGMAEEDQIMAYLERHDLQEVIDSSSFAPAAG